MSDNKLQDEMTSVIKRAIDLLFVKNPVGTAMGVLLGIGLFWLSMLFLPVINGWSLINTNALKLQYFIPVGIFIFNIKHALFKGHRLDPEIEKVLEQVRVAEKNKLITKQEAKLQYTSIIRIYVDGYKTEKSARLNEKT